MKTEAKIINQSRLTSGQARYWLSKAKQLSASIDWVDPWRLRIAQLRKMGITGKVYRASTGGKWGKSSQVITLS